MTRIVVAGGGVGGLTAAMLLAGDGHEVTVLERDPSAPPSAPEEAWRGWERRGINQFRMLHYFQPQFRVLVEAELPRVADALDADGALRFNPVALAPDDVTGDHRPGDEAFEVLTGRRPVVESVLAGVTSETPGVSVRRGVIITGLITDTESEPGVPNVTGVRTEDGNDILADLVVDACGRRSPLPRWLDSVGARPSDEELEDSGFVYYGRHFRSSDGSIPPMMAPLLAHYGSVSILTLPADNGTWGVGIVASARDAEMRGLRDVDRWAATIKHFPLVAHWAEGQPINDEVAVMAKIEDRIRRYVVDGTPVATGVVAVADAWACTNPSLGRGATIGLMHTLELRNLLRRSSADDAAGFARAWDDVTQATVEPLYRATLRYDRHRLTEAEAATRGEPYEPDDVEWEMTRALQYGSLLDPDLFRGFLRIAGLLSTPNEVFAQSGFADKVVAVGADWRNEEIFGPSRAELVDLVSG